jgi:tetratricopeptide (TPR) repeat protein
VSVTRSADRSTLRPRASRGRLCASLATLAVSLASTGLASPYAPADDAQVLAELPAGARHASTPSRDLTRTRLDIALPLAQFDISRSRATGDLRFLGYAEALLTPWLNRTPAPAQVLVLHATILQSRHQFRAALGELDQALRIRPDDPQAWLTRATVLRVIGHYPEALESCSHLAAAADPAIVVLCTQSVQSLSGHLRSAYAAVAALPQQSLPPEARAWRYSELGEMAERLGGDADAEHWLHEGLQVAPDDFYLRGALADLLLRHARAAETLELLHGYESMEPMLLRTTIAHLQLHDGAEGRSRELLQNAFGLEQQRGDAVHRREQARFLLDVDHQPAAALDAARENWQVQREPADVLILLRAAHAAGKPELATPALEFLHLYGLEDARALSARGATP